MVNSRAFGHVLAQRLKNSTADRRVAVSFGVVFHVGAVVVKTDQEHFPNVFWTVGKGVQFCQHVENSVSISAEGRVLCARLTAAGANLKRRRVKGEVKNWEWKAKWQYATRWEVLIQGIFSGKLFLSTDKRKRLNLWGNRSGHTFNSPSASADELSAPTVRPCLLWFFTCSLRKIGTMLVETSEWKTCLLVLREK